MSDPVPLSADPDDEGAARHRAEATERSSGEDAGSAHEKVAGHAPADAAERASGGIEDGTREADG